VTFLVLAPHGSEYTLVAFDTEHLPSPLPATGVTTFSLPTPITVSAGDVIGLTAPASNEVDCDFGKGSVPMTDVASAGAITTLTVGASWGVFVTEGPYLINVSADLAQSEDVGVTAAATPGSITAGGAAGYSFMVSDPAPGSGSITFSDTVPSGLTILSAVAGSGSCSVAGDTVTCTISGLQAGSSAPVAILVSAPNAGVYGDTATVSTPLEDPNPANNAATATLTVSAPAAPAPAPCKVLRLTGAPLAVAKAVIPTVDCKVGKVTRKASKSVRSGLVISTSPGAGVTLSAGGTVNLVVSSGPPRKHKHKHKK
jgi:hypothetical protein